MSATIPHPLEATATSPTTVLYGKLLKVARSIARIEKRGRNDHHKYDYVQAQDVTDKLREKLHREKLIVLPSTIPGSARHEAAIGGRGMVTTIDLVYRIVDTETGAMVELPWTAVGADTGGDKGIYKAYTGGLKYALLNAFLIPTGDDPERDQQTETGQPARGGSVQQDAERPAAPRIPLDRAKSILEAAKAAGLVNDDDSFTPVLKAKLADVGVDKIGALNVDQAEDVERFIAEETQSS